MKVSLANIIVKTSLEILVFAIITIIIFNELTQILKTLNLFKEESIKLIGFISFILATDNLLSQKFLGLNIFK